MKSSFFGLRSSAFGLRSSVFGLRSSVFGLRSSVFGLRIVDTRIHRDESAGGVQLQLLLILRILSRESDYNLRQKSLGHLPKSGTCEINYT